MGWENKKHQEAEGFLGGRQWAGPLFLMILTPLSVIILWYTSVHLDGSLWKTAQFFGTHGPYGFYLMYPSWGDMFAATKYIFPFMAVQLLFMKVMPGPDYQGPMAPSGHIPVYKANGVATYCTTLALYFILSLLGIYTPGTLYSIYGPFLAFMSFFSFIFCTLLLIKGHIAPTGKDTKVPGNFVLDFYRGLELYPRVFGWDVKVFSNCRFGMMLWPIACIDYVFAQRALYGSVSDSLLVSAALQVIYVSKFFYWETGYFRSMDIMFDRAGYYLCWGCFTFVPSLYTSHAFYMVNHPVHLGTPLALLIFAIGCGAIFVNYDADRQRQTFREQNGRVKIWGKAPSFITARYKTEKGEEKQSLLLCSGWWSITRHFHYIPEWTAAFCWSCPAGFTHALPFTYFFFLLVLLFDRSFRDDARCRSKYGADWDKYCEKVPYKIIPYIL